MLGLSLCRASLKQAPRGYRKAGRQPPRCSSTHAKCHSAREQNSSGSMMHVRAVWAAALGQLSPWFHSLQVTQIHGSIYQQLNPSMFIFSSPAFLPSWTLPFVIPNPCSDGWEVSQSMISAAPEALQRVAKGRGIKRSGDLFLEGSPPCA